VEAPGEWRFIIRNGVERLAAAMSDLLDQQLAVRPAVSSRSSLSWGSNSGRQFTNNRRPILKPDLTVY